MKIGITGQNGFIGYHLTQTIKYKHSDFTIVPFQKSFFEDEGLLIEFVSTCNVIVHLAGVNRANTDQEVYDGNIEITNSLKKALVGARYQGQLLFASSTQEYGRSLYGKAKKESRQLLEACVNDLGGTFTGLLIPNIFGPFCKPNYNSFIATFSQYIINDVEPKIITENDVEILYVGNLVEVIISKIKNPSETSQAIGYKKTIKVSQVLKQIKSFQKIYVKKGDIPPLETAFDVQLFNTFRS